MLNYTICNMADDDVFEKQCQAIEKKVHPLEKESILNDVDGSCIQTYHHNGNKIVIHNDYAVDAVYIESEISLEEFFN